jgi:hypothetical protein
MSKEITFENINVEDSAQKSKIQFESKIFNMVNLFIVITIINIILICT